MKSQHLKEISKSYTTLLTDFNETLRTLNETLKESSKLLEKYVETSVKIYNTYNKYKD